jgi:DNA-directed RNA polymerase specialized sigma24 family protein
MKSVPADLAPPVVATAVGSSFEDFYRAQAGRVHRALAVTLADADVAREATDEAMARACARWGRVSELDNPGGWVYRVGLNWATSWWRKVGRERPFSVDDHGGLLPPVEPGATTALVALRGLGTHHRAVVVCRVLLDLSVAETAVVLAISEGTVKSRLARALAALRTALSEES